MEKLGEGKVWGSGENSEESQRHWESLDTDRHWEKGLKVTTEHNSSEGRHAGKEESKMSKIQRNWAGRKAGFHVPVGAQV